MTSVPPIDRAGLVDATRSLVRLRSDEGEERACKDFVADRMRSAGLDTDVWEIDLDRVQAHPEASWEIEREGALGVVGSLEGTGDGPTLLLNGHVDVVPAGDEALWTHPPYEGVVEDGRIYGRGALDMKGPLMAGLFAMRAVADAGLRLKGSVRLMSVVAEEDGGLGTLAAILRGHRGDGAIVMEPTELAVAPVQAGCVNFRIHVPGLAAHGAVREEGVSAFEKLFAVYGAVMGLEEERNRDVSGNELFSRYRLPYPISIGTMAGGDWASSVPDHARMEGRMGVRPEESLDEARTALERTVAEAAAADPFLRDHTPVVEWWGGRFLPARMDPEHPLADRLAGAFAHVTGRSPRREAVPFGADAGLLQHVGATPTLLFGAGDIRRAHRPDEFVAIEELVTMAQVLAQTIVDYCGVTEA
jgi:acetylornithine deacetylase